MKIFFYKTLLIALIFFITFKLTIGSVINEIEHKITQTISKENAEKIKQDLREGMIKAIEKEKIVAEKINGRFAMLGFIALVGAYLTTGQIIPGFI